MPRHRWVEFVLCLSMVCLAALLAPSRAGAVTVIVQETKSQSFNVVGEVQRPGAYVFGHPVNVLDAVALAGGFRDFAKQKSIYILRKNADGGQSRLPFNYKDVVKGKNAEQNVKLQPGDTVVVP